MTDVDTHSEKLKNLFDIGCKGELYQKETRFVDNPDIHLNIL